VAGTTGVGGTTGMGGTTGVGGTTGAGGGAFCVGAGGNWGPLPGGVDGGSAAGSEGGAHSPTWAQCTDLEDDAPLAPVRFHAGERPPETLGCGGTIVDGVYDLVGADVYRSADSPPLTSRITIRISQGGTELEWAAEDDYGRFVRTLAMVNATQLLETETCRNGGDVQQPGISDYTATPSLLMLSNPLYVQWFALRQP
jgi:hypothetical protein